MSWHSMMKIAKACFVRSAKKLESHCKELEVRTWVTKPFTNWKKTLEKMKAHSQSDIHVQAFQASMLAERAGRAGTIMQQLQQITDEEKMKNRAAVKALIHCPHFLARQHIAHSTNFEKLYSQSGCGLWWRRSQTFWNLLVKMLCTHHE